MTTLLYDINHKDGDTHTQRQIEYFHGPNYNAGASWYYSFAYNFSVFQTGGTADCEFKTNDSIDGGLRCYVNDADNSSPSAVFTTTRSGQTEALAFNPHGSRFLANCKKGGVVGTTDVGIKYGLANDVIVNPAHRSLMVEGTLASYKSLQCGDGSSGSDTATSIALGTALFEFDIDLNPSNNILTIDGVVGCTRTTVLPHAKMRPFIYIQSRSNAGEKFWNTNYMEVYNK